RPYADDRGAGDQDRRGRTQEQGGRRYPVVKNRSVHVVWRRGFGRVVRLQPLPKRSCRLFCAKVRTASSSSVRTGPSRRIFTGSGTARSSSFGWNELH